MNGEVVVFCKKGHIVRVTDRDKVPATDPTVCQWCGSKELAEVADPFENGIVPKTPISKEWVKVNFDEFRGEMKVGVYDIRRISPHLFERYQKGILPNLEEIKIPVEKN